MNIKKLDPYKKLFVNFINLMPIESMEFDIQNNNDSLIKQMYKSLIISLEDITDKREKKILYKLGISSIYSQLDPVYGEPIRWILSQLDFSNVNVIPPREWRINKEVK